MMPWRRRRGAPLWLDRLFGPSGPEVTCEECFDSLDRYVELELDGADAGAQIPGMRAHLEGCPACREEHDLLLEYVRDQDRL
jgi:predicted anti-sigma-YlaC factor YlaD